MGELKLVYFDDGKHKAGSFAVSVNTVIDDRFSDVIAPSDIIGEGSNYGAALEDYKTQFNEYIKKLVEFRDTVLNTKKSYEEAIEVDWAGKPVRRKEE